MARSADAHDSKADDPTDLGDQLRIVHRSANSTDSGRPAVLVNSSEAADCAVHSSPPGNPAVRTVVLCDDQQVLRDAISLLLMNFPRYRVVGQAIDAASCLEAIIGLEPDILIMDVSMPGGGPDLVRAARAARARRSDLHM